MMIPPADAGLGYRDPGMRTNISDAGLDMFLYWDSGCISCTKPMIVLEEKGLSGYGNKLVEVSKKEHKGEENLKLNPRGQLPTFKHGRVVVNESTAICHYLESQFKKQGTQLIPDDATKQGLVLQRLYEVENLTDKAFRDIYYYLKFNKDPVDEKLMKTKKKALTEELVHWEKYLSAGEFLCGSEFTMADVFLVTTLIFMVRCGLDLSQRPNIKRYYDKVSQRPSVQASWPPSYKTSTPSTTFSGV